MHFYKHDNYIDNLENGGLTTSGYKLD